MPEKELNLKPVIRNYVLKVGGLLKEELDDSRFEFGFKFLYPSKNGRLMMVIKPKNKENVEISLGTPLSPEHKKRFDSLGEVDKKYFVKNLQKLLFRAELDYSYNFTQHYTIVLIDKIFLEDNLVSINNFFRSVRKVYSNTMNIVFFVMDFFSDEINPPEFTTKKF